MKKRRFIIEMGMGIDAHGQDITTAAMRAVKDAVARVSLLGLFEMVTLNDRNDMLVDVLIACPRPEEVNTNEVLHALPFGQKEIKVVEGGMVARGHCTRDLGDKSDEIIVANAAITVSIDVDTVELRG